MYICHILRIYLPCHLAATCAGSCEMSHGWRLRVCSVMWPRRFVLWPLHSVSYGQRLHNCLGGCASTAPLCTFLVAWWDLPLGYRRGEGTQWKVCDTFRRNGWFRLPKWSPDLWLAASPRFRDTVWHGAKTGLWSGWTAWRAVFSSWAHHPCTKTTLIH